MISLLRSRTSELARCVAPLALAAVLATIVSGCQTMAPTETTGSIGAAATAPGEGDWHKSAEAWGERYRADPKDPDAAMNYARALRGNGQRAQAVAVLELASIQNP